MLLSSREHPLQALEKLAALGAESAPQEDRRRIPEHVPPARGNGAEGRRSRHLAGLVLGTPEIAEVFSSNEPDDRGKIPCIDVPEDHPTERKYVTVIKLLMVRHELPLPPAGLTATKPQLLTGSESP